MKIIVRAIYSRMEYVDEITRRRIPGLSFVFDKTGNAMDTFLYAMGIAGTQPCVHMEDDIILTTDFHDKLIGAINKHPDKVIQFFSMRKKDLTEGSRMERGSTFMMNQCFYLPAEYSLLIKEYYNEWPQKEAHPTGYDILIADFLKKRKEKYYLHCPSLVQHRICVSAIDKRRSKHRQSLTFVP